MATMTTSRDDVTTGQRVARRVRAQFLRVRPAGVVFALAALLFAVTSAYLPGFASRTSISQLLISAAFIGIVGIGQTFVILTGGIDLSVPWTMATAGVLVSNWVAAGTLPPVPAIVVSLLVCAAIGAVSGLGVAWLRISPIVMTLGMAGVVTGGLLASSGGVAPARAPAALTAMTATWIAPVRWTVVIWAVAVVVSIVALRLTSFGRWVFAVGTSQAVARLAGVPVRRTIILCYALSAVFAGVAGLLFSGFVGVPYFGMGESYLFTSIAATVIGGTALIGGRGGQIGTVGGALVLTVLAGLLPTLGLGEGALLIVYGVIILGALGAARATEDLTDRATDVQAVDDPAPTDTQQTGSPG